MSGQSTAPAEHVFGPVPSRRLGLSLGVDLVPHKVCTMDCVYCQVGRTTCKTVARAIHVPVATILAEIEEKLADRHRPDYITLAGSGEPTLHAGLGEIVVGIKRIADVPVAVLTNGSMLSDPAVRAACAAADVVLPSLDAGDEETFQAVNRPAASLSLAGLVAGMEAFRKEYRGQIWLEVFIVKGVNSSPGQIEKIRALAERIAPDRIQLNTAVRPTADAGVVALTEAEMEDVRRLMGPKAEIIADFRKVGPPGQYEARAEEVLAMIRRRPVTLDDIAEGLGAHRAEISKHLEALVAKGVIAGERRGGRDYFVPRK